MTDEALLALIAQYERTSLGSETASGATIGNLSSKEVGSFTTLEIERYDALNDYFARDYEASGHGSKIVLPELRDTIEWMMPQLMRLFLSSRTPCVFDPEGPDDVQRAQRETEAVNHVFMRLNDGPTVVYDYIKDSLLLRNSYVRVETCEEDTVEEETYSGLTEVALTQLLSDKGDEKVEIVGQREYTCDVPPPLDAPIGTPTQQVPCFDVKIRIKTRKKRVNVECLPPEEIRVAAGTRTTNLDKSHFVAHIIEKTRSELIQEGFDRDIVNSAQPGRPNWLDLDALARDQAVDELQQTDPEFASQKVQFRSVTIKVDFDGDGIAERRQVAVIGDKIADNEIVEECPIASGSPMRMPHRHSGISMHDLLKDIQRIKSELARRALDGLKQSIAGRMGVDWKNCNLTDLLTWRPNGVVRTNGPPQQVLMPLTSENHVVDQAMPFMQYVDQWRQFRTGVGDQAIGLDPDALQDVTKGGQLAAMSAASLKIEMIARLLAEGLKDVFLKIHSNLIRHQDEPMSFQLGNEWVQENPQMWKKRTRVSPNVGLGSGNREEARANLAMLNAMQEKAAAMGLISPQNVYNTFKMGVALLGYEHPEQFAMNPQSKEYAQAQAQRQQEPPDPRIQAAQINAQSGLQQEQMRQQGKVIQLQGEVQKAQIDAATAREHAQAQLLHEAIQNREDRSVEMAGNDASMAMNVLQTLGKLLAPIIAAQYKQDPSANAGEVMREDIQALEGR